MNKEIWILRIDFYLQVNLAILIIIDVSFSQNYATTLLFTFMCVQSASIIYHCLIRRTKFSTLRNFHYGATCGVLIIIFMLMAGDKYFGEAGILVLMIVSICSIVLFLLYLIATWNELYDAKMKQK